MIKKLLISYCNDVIHAITPQDKERTPVLIGTVLGRLEAMMWAGELGMKEHCKIEIKLLGLWRKRGFTDDLFSILNDAGYYNDGEENYVMVLEVIELFEFLGGIFIKESTE